MREVQAGVLVLAAFLLLTAWAFMQPLGAGPDEKNALHGGTVSS